MDQFFLLVEIASYLFAVYLFLYKKELSIIYLPLLIFANSIIVPVFSFSIYYALISLLLLTGINSNTSFFKNNIYAFLILLYFLLLLPKSEDVQSIRPFVFSTFWLFISIPLISTIYQKFERDEIFKEVSLCALLILILFILNVLFSTLYNYAPAEMYGITSGILYGNLYAANFNILTIAIFITALYLVRNKSLLHIVALILSLSFLLLSMRRSVMLTSCLGVMVVLMSFLAKKEAKKFLVFGCLILVVGYFIYSSTNFMDMFQERYELRNLEERELEGEGRFMEYQILYEDMFVYNEYSPWFGFELFNSSGNYGHGIFDMRTLHSDLTNIAHSSGLIGVALYLFMVITAFYKSWHAKVSTNDKVIFFFCALTFVVFSITGRYTQVDYMILLYLILLLPLTNKSDNAHLLSRFEFS